MINFIQQAEDRLFKHKTMDENKPIMQTEVVEETPVVSQNQCSACGGLGLNEAQSARCASCGGTGKV